MKTLKNIFIIFIGLILGISLNLIIKRTGPKPYVNINIDNKSDEIINRITITDDVFKNTYLIENLDINANKSISLLATGEIAYEIIAILSSKDTLISGAYAESGYNDKFIITTDSIEYYPGIYTSF